MRRYGFHGASHAYVAGLAAFGDVLIRVKDSFKLEMHIDTDEANAAELSAGAPGDLVCAAPRGRAGFPDRTAVARNASSTRRAGWTSAAVKA